MPIHGAAEFFSSVGYSQLVIGAAAVSAVITFKAWAGGRRTTWERDWAGKMIFIIVRTLVLAPVHALSSRHHQHRPSSRL